MCARLALEHKVQLTPITFNIRNETRTRNVQSDWCLELAVVATAITDPDPYHQRL
jgi:hypothetical protein